MKNWQKQRQESSWRRGGLAIIVVISEFRLSLQCLLPHITAVSVQVQTCTISCVVYLGGSDCHFLSGSRQLQVRPSSPFGLSNYLHLLISQVKLM